MRNLLAGVIIFLAACGTGQKTNESRIKSDALFDEIMILHDEVMPEMGKLRKKEKGFMDLIDSLKDSGGAENAIGQIVVKQMELKFAQEEMMKWMRSFSPQKLDSLDEPGKIKYLQDQLERVKKINTNIKAALKL